MIKVHRVLPEEKIKECLVNRDAICYAQECDGKTTIMLVSGQELQVSEPLDEICRRFNHVEVREV